MGDRTPKIGGDAEVRRVSMLGDERHTVDATVKTVDKGLGPAYLSDRRSPKTGDNLTDSDRGQGAPTRRGPTSRCTGPKTEEPVNLSLGISGGFRAVCRRRREIGPKEVV